MTHMEAGRPRESVVTATRAVSAYCCDDALVDGLSLEHHASCAEAAARAPQRDALFDLTAPSTSQAARFADHADCITRAANDPDAHAEPAVRARLLAMAHAARAGSLVAAAAAQVVDRG